MTGIATLQTDTNLAAILAAQEDKILACVHCGLCLEACPTYVATGDENDSPRGRIYLMRAVEEGRLANTSVSFERHIDRCLGCRACEAACPAGVAYGQLLEAARAEIMQARPRRGAVYSFLKFALRHVWLKPKRLAAAFAFARFLRDSGIAGLLLKTKLTRRISPRFEFALALLDSSNYRTARRSERVSQAGRMPANRRQAAGAPGSGSERVSPARDGGAPNALLFKACVTEGLFPRVNEATRRVLEANACVVQEPGGQVCCGALHAHAGDLSGARLLARQNIDAFNETSSQASEALPIVTNAGGCGAMLASYAHLLADDEKYAGRARIFSARVRDVGQRLQATGLRNGVAIGSERTTYDASCHLLHGQNGAEASLQMLWAIPDLNFARLNDSDVCCGGAGVYNMLEPELSAQVLAEKLGHIKETGATVLATGNAGCQMQISAGARLAGMSLRVCHPVELLDESYRRAGYYEDSDE